MGTVLLMDKELIRAILWLTVGFLVGVQYMMKVKPPIPAETECLCEVVHETGEMVQFFRAPVHAPIKHEIEEFECEIEMDGEMHKAPCLK